MPGSQTVQSLERGLRILALAVQHAGSGSGGLMLAEVCEDLGVKPPTAHNLTRTLLAQGFLEKTGARPIRFVPGPAWRRLAAMSGEARRGLGDILETGLQRLHERLPRLSVVISRDRGVDVFTILRMTADRPGVLQKDPGNWLAPYITASSLCFLGFWPDDKLRMFRERYPFEDYGIGFWGSHEAFETALRRVRKSGHALGGRAQGRLFRVAAPLFGPDGRILAALGASESTRDEVPDEEIPAILDTLTGAAREIQSELDSAAPGPSSSSSQQIPNIDL